MQCQSNFNDDITTINRNGDVVTDSETEAKTADVLAALTAANAMLAPLFKMIDERRLDDVDARFVLEGSYDQISELVYIVTGNTYDELMDDFGIDADKLEARFAEIVRAKAIFAARRSACLPSGVENVPSDIRDAGYRWTPSIHMPRAVSRLTLEVTEVRHQLLHEISEADAAAEGALRDEESCDHSRRTCAGVGCLRPTHKSSFGALWESLHGQGNWKANPEIVALSFRVHRQNVDVFLTGIAAV